MPEVGGNGPTELEERHVFKDSISRNGHKTVEERFRQDWEDALTEDSTLEVVEGKGLRYPEGSYCNEHPPADEHVQPPSYSSHLYSCSDSVKEESEGHGSDQAVVRPVYSPLSPAVAEVTDGEEGSRNQFSTPLVDEIRERILILTIVEAEIAERAWVEYGNEWYWQCRDLGL